MLDQFGENRHPARQVRLGARQNCVIVVAVGARRSRTAAGENQNIQEASFPCKRGFSTPELVTALLSSPKLRKRQNQDGFPLARE
jgi:hypothetical protein